MTQPGMRGMAALASGAMLGVGLVLSGMTEPRRVIGFLDLLGNWDPTLLLVMASAVSVHFVAHRVIRGWRRPLLADKFALPTRRDIDPKLLVGSAIFGVGWGLGGFCPGPGIVSLGSAQLGAIAFVTSLVIGMIAGIKLERLLEHRVTESSSSAPASIRLSGGAARGPLAE